MGDDTASLKRMTGRVSRRVPERDAEMMAVYLHTTFEQSEDDHKTEILSTNRRSQSISSKHKLSKFQTSLWKIRHSRLEKLRRNIELRAILKNGDSNVDEINIFQAKSRFFMDLFTTLVNLSWQATLLAISFVLFTTWAFWAVMWWLIAYANGDLDQEVNKCLVGVHGFLSAFTFSVETQQTIGYGARYMTGECYAPIIVLCMQSIVGFMLQSVIVGIVFAKISRPKLRSRTIMFSKDAVVCLRDGFLCLMFRVSDLRACSSRLMSKHVTAWLIQSKLTEENEELFPYVYDLELRSDDCKSGLLLAWPAIVYHRIDEASPLYAMSADDKDDASFEIIVTLDGTAESNGQQTQARTSYLPSEVQWGHRLHEMTTYDSLKLAYTADFQHFHKTEPVETPRCSARELAESGSDALAFEKAPSLSVKSQASQSS